MNLLHQTFFIIVCNKNKELLGKIIKAHIKKFISKGNFLLQNENDFFFFFSAWGWGGGGERAFDYILEKKKIVVFIKEHPSIFKENQLDYLM